MVKAKLLIDAGVTTEFLGGQAVTDFVPPARPIVGDEEREAVDRVLRSGMLAQGPEVKAFEEEFAAHFGLGRACVAVNSGKIGRAHV